MYLNFVNHARWNIRISRTAFVYDEPPPEGGVLPEKLGGGVRPASQTPYPIYDQDLQYNPYPIYDLTKNSKPYLRPDS